MTRELKSGVHSQTHWCFPQLASQRQILASFPGSFQGRGLGTRLRQVLDCELVCDSLYDTQKYINSSSTQCTDFLWHYNWLGVLVANQNDKHSKLSAQPSRSLCAYNQQH